MPRGLWCRRSAGEGCWARRWRMNPAITGFWASTSRGDKAARCNFSPPPVTPVAFGGENPGGTLAITAPQVGNTIAAPPFAIADRDPPVLSVALYGQDGANTAVAPVAAHILVGDFTHTATRWELKRAATGAVVYSGRTNHVEEELAALHSLQSEEYVLEVFVADAAGNTATHSIAFLNTL